MSDDRLATVRGLLAKAEATDNEHERDAYNAKAAELIARYGIDEALLAARGSTRPVAGDRIVKLEAPYARDKSHLLHCIAKPLGVKTVQLRAGGADLRVHLFGMAADLERVEVLFTSLLVQASHGLAGARPDGFDIFESVAAYRRTWFAGFSSVIMARLTAAEAKAADEAQDVSSNAGGPSVALVLADRESLVAAAQAATYPRLRTVRRSLSGSGAGAGQAAGRRADLGGGRIGGSSRGALS